MVKSSCHWYFRSSHHLYSIFLSRVKTNLTNWPAHNIFIAQLVEHRSANAEAMGSNPVEALKEFINYPNIVSRVFIKEKTIGTRLTLLMKILNHVTSPNLDQTFLTT